MLLDVQHVTTFSYDEPIIESTMEARLGPWSDQDQRSHSFELLVQPTTRVFSYKDGFGNLVHCFTILPLHERLILTARSRVETLLGNPFVLPARPFAPPDPVDTWPYLQFGGPVLPLDEITRLAQSFRPIEDAHMLPALQDLMHAIHQGFAYQAEVTTVSSTVADFLDLGKGVCQDFAHLMIAACRTLGVPARYVSGYILSSPERMPRGGGASHAWCEALIPGYGWRGFDPTNDILAADGHVKVAIGRHYHDVPPTRGIYRGPASETITVAVQTLRADASPL
jgi:transglutaminase-like putative cysteine protease